MWILNGTLQKLHKERITIGLKGYVVEGRDKVAECEIIQIVNLGLK